jgi:hypothetical protein
MAAIGFLTAIVGFFSFLLSTTSVVDPLQFPVIHSRVAALFGTVASLAIMTVGAQLTPH